MRGACRYPVRVRVRVRVRSACVVFEEGVGTRSKEVSVAVRPCAAMRVRVGDICRLCNKKQEYE